MVSLSSPVSPNSKPEREEATPALSEAVSRSTSISRVPVVLVVAIPEPPVKLAVPVVVILVVREPSEMVQYW